MSYNKDINYKEKIDEAVKNKDYLSAAELEASRNEKIDAESLPYEKTNRFSGWLDKTDYSIKLKDQMAANAPKSQVATTLKSRINKASGTEGLSHYAYDSVYDDAIKYLLGYGGFTYEEKKPEYNDPYGEKIDRILSRLEKLPEFEYDPEDDELYRYYKEQYNREGRKAMEDLLGELSMNTGGVASSYAVSAAGQLIGNYNDKLTDIIPKLYKDAYDRYLDSFDLEKDTLGLLLDISDIDYKHYLDALDRYNADREFDYGVFTDGLEREELLKKHGMEEIENEQKWEEIDLKKDESKRKWEEFEYEKTEDDRKWTQQDYENSENRTQTAIENALKKWEALGYLDSESAAILGLPEGIHTSDYDYKKAQQYRLYNK